MDKHPDKGPQVAGVTWAFGTISTIAILLRIYCRVFMVKCFGLDDWTAVIAQILFISYCVCFISGAHYGTGQHAKIILPENLPIALKWWWLCEPLYILINMFIKFSIAVFLLRICNVKTHKIIIWVTLALAELYGFAFLIIFILQCRPASYFWNRFSLHPPSHGSCFSVNIVTGFLFAYSAICCLTDWTLSILPGFIVWNLQMNRGTRLSVCAILAVSAVASMATLIRLRYLHAITEATGFFNATTDIAIWSTIEIGIGITASAMPTLRPLLRSSLEYVRTITSNTKRSSRSGSKSTDSNASQHDSKRTNTQYDISMTEHREATTMTKTHQLGRDEEMDIGSHEGGAESSRSRSWNDDGSQSPNTHQPWNIKVSKSVVQTHDCI